MLTPTLHHFNIKTKRMAEMIEWYGTVVGATVQFQNEFAAWMTNDGANHRITFLTWPGLRDGTDQRNHTGLHHAAFEYPSFADLMSSYERLRDLGITPAVCLDHGMTTSMYYHDPDGNFVELQSDIFGDWERSSEWMRTELQFVEQTIGIYFDPEAVFRAHRDGQNYTTIRSSIVSGAVAPKTTPDLGLPA